eukprot:m.136318 g.136318  ORF g.136318 m.136318 type:complete len:76 (+) comp52470_c0_seq14:83-310(+)
MQRIPKGSTCQFSSGSSNTLWYLKGPAENGTAHMRQQKSTPVCAPWNTAICAGACRSPRPTSHETDLEEIIITKH